jgi:dienelactone hydrolase
LAAGPARKRIVQRVELERAVGGGRELHLTYHLGDDHPVPAILLLPHARGPAPGPAPAAVLVHGYSSRKEDVAGPVGRALLALGIASLALDLPLHGTRADPVEAQAARNPLTMVRLWRHGLADIRLGLRYIAARPEVDADRLALVGYSMGSFLSVAVAAQEPAVRAIVLAAGGDLPLGTPFEKVARMAADPIRAVRKLRGRPLLMVHGRNDRTVRPDQAQRLFDAAHEPKRIMWFDSGHYLPRAATDAAAGWLRERLEEIVRSGER